MSVEQVAIEAAKQAPVLALFIVVVLIFLKHVKEISESNSTHQRSLMESHARRTDEFINTVKDMNSEDRESRDRNTEAVSHLGNEITRLSERMTTQTRH